jgi:NAD(P)-dependent dehydrogenase (short-subunit alcohol dehydrogenase family)
MLLYLAPRLLRTTGFLIALVLCSLAVGCWAGGDERADSRRRWVFLLLAYVAAGIYAVLWTTQATLRGSTLGGALAALFLIAQPAYTTGALLPTMRLAASGYAAAFFGAGTGAALAAAFLIPSYDADVIFFATATVLLVARLWYETAAVPLQTKAFRVSLTGKTVLVTGVGAPGQVGFALARAFVAAGARVVAVGHAENIVETARSIGDEYKIVGHRADLTSADEVTLMMDAVRSRFGELHAVVNAVGGLSVLKPIAETEPEDWRREIQRNGDTVFLVNRAALPLVRATRGAIINFAAPAGIRAQAQLGAYSAAKAVVVALTRTLALEEKDNGVRVNAIAPGLIDTEQNREAMKDQENVRFVSRQQITDVVLFLCSDAGSGVTGETIHVLAETIA